MHPADESQTSVVLHVWLPCLIAFAIFVVSVVADLSEPSSNWTQRAGTLLIVVGAYVGYHEAKQSLKVIDGNLYLNPELWYKILAVAFVITGTIVSGYGDLIVGRLTGQLSVAPAMPEPTTATSSIPWLATVTPVVTFILGFISAVFAEPARHWLFRPVLRLSFSGGEDCIARTPTVGGSEAIYIRIKVVNVRPRLARACRAYLVNVETKSTATGFVNTLYADSIQLAWACQVAGSERNPLDLPNGVSQYVDVIATSKASNSFAPQISPYVLRYHQLFSPKSETYRLTIQVSGDGIEPKILRLVFVWKGQWDTIEAYEDTTQA